MKCRERLQLEHPEYIDDLTEGGCIGCPDFYGYLPKPKECGPQSMEKITCTECWDRESPCEEAG